MVIHLPQPKQVRDLLADLLGRDVTLSPTTPFAPGPDTPASVAVYVDDQLRICALIACDLTFSAHAGAAIGLVPVGGAEAAIEDGKLTDTLGENLYEVLNIAASMFNVPGADHLMEVPTDPVRSAAILEQVAAEVSAFLAALPL